MTLETALLRRVPPELRQDSKRVITRLYLPGQEIKDDEISRADAVIERIMGMTEEEVFVTLEETVGSYENRHHNIRATWLENYGHVEHRLPRAVDVSVERRELIGSYFTKEYAIEGAALFNPSICAHPDQTGLKPGELRFIMSARAVGEGHISSIEFRTGVLTSKEIQIDQPGQHLLTGKALHRTMTRDFLRTSLAELKDVTPAKALFNLLPEVFDARILDSAIATVEKDELTHASTREIIKDIKWIFSCSYRVDFPHDRPLSERILFPTAVDESQGMEDARFTLFVDEQGNRTYYASYTAYDGSRVKPHLIQTSDFQTFEITRLVGPAAKNKGMAIFPRKIMGKYFALSRWDRESISVATSPDTKIWGDAVDICIPEQPWEFIQMGNCGPPMETPEGWLVITHGVGPMREYGIGAVLLDLDNPTIVLATLSQPLLTAAADERDGYTPNIVYSCGALIHEQTLILPYGYSDEAIRFALVDLPKLMNTVRTCL
ncbi:MAG: glycoside hydrolase family 130 protein [Actinobacteria bacterium]|nr:glycoside hydrolase family 130 protein [Actinomycetota bacterium]